MGVGAAAIALVGLLVHLLNDDHAVAADATAVEAVIVEATTSTDPEICDHLFSAAWLDAHFASSTARCREATSEMPESKAESVTVTDVSVDGTRARASASVAGGNVGAAALAFELVEDRGWKLDRLAAIDIDRDAYLAVQRRAVGQSTLIRDAEPLMECMLDFADANVSEKEIEASLLAGNEGFYAGADRSCESEFRRMLFSPTIIGAKTSYSPSDLRCISDTASHLIQDSELRRLFVAFVAQRESPDVLASKRQVALDHCLA